MTPLLGPYLPGDFEQPSSVKGTIHSTHMKTRILGLVIFLTVSAFAQQYDTLVRGERLDHRGLLRTDYFADITIFNPATVLDTATFELPNRPSVGIEYVLVNGVLALEREKTTEQFGGRPLRGPAYQARGIAPEGLAPKGGVRGFVSDSDGWPLPRTKVVLSDASGKEVGSATSGREGKFEILLEQPCDGCTLSASALVLPHSLER